MLSWQIAETIFLNVFILVNVYFISINKMFYGFDFSFHLYFSFNLFHLFFIQFWV